MSIGSRVHDSETQPTSNGNFLLVLHVEVPYHEPRKNGKRKVHGDEPSCNSDQVSDQELNTAAATATGKPTSNSIPNIREINPARSLNPAVPAPLDRGALDYNNNASEERDDDRDDEANADKGDLDLVADDSEEEHADGTLANPDDHDPCKLAEDFILDGLKVDVQVADVARESAQAEDARYRHEDGVEDVEGLWYVSAFCQ
jgi:hypothetical protein